MTEAERGGRDMRTSPAAPVSTRLPFELEALHPPDALATGTAAGR